MTKIVSWNVNSIRVRLPHLIELSKNVKPDVIMLQETKSTDDNFPNDEIERLGYKIIKKGQKSYNGVAIVSKKKLENVKKGFYDCTDYNQNIEILSLIHI